MRRPLEPIEISVSAILVISGLAQLIGGSGPSAVSAQMPDAFRYTWLVMSVAGGLGVLVSAVLRDLITALYVEMVGLMAVAVATGVYGIAITIVAFQRGTVGNVMAGPMVLALSVGFYLRHRQLRRLVERFPHRDD